MYLWVSTKVEWLYFFTRSNNDELFRKASKDASSFSGNAPEYDVHLSHSFHSLRDFFYVLSHENTSFVASFADEYDVCWSLGIFQVSLHVFAFRLLKSQLEEEILASHKKWSRHQNGLLEAISMAALCLYLQIF